jgi:hypothetical protein
MKRLYSFQTPVSIALATLDLTIVARSQTPQSAQKAAKAPPKSQAPTPVTMTECEGVNNCATWTFLGSQGNGQWPSGEVANLSVERYDDNSVVIRRADSTGASAGLTAVLLRGVSLSNRTSISAVLALRRYEPRIAERLQPALG